LVLAAGLLAILPCAAETLRIVTFNVRYPASGDGPDIWDNRRDLLVDTVRKHAPDVMGTQELFKLQGDYIVSKLPEYAWFGVSRRGNEQDEYMGVFYKKSALTLEDSGNFWLSESPSEPGSIAWNMSLPRMATWGVFKTRSGLRFLYVNTHFAHRGEDGEARLNSARLIRKWIESRPEKLPVVLTGDFNTGSGTPPYAELTTLLKDSWTVASKKSGPEGTFHGFKGKPGAARIDWILFNAPWTVPQARSIDDNRDGRYPSDHFAVLAVFETR
jgi:endonuclease/exonuclease/phosphatase family metal-dependent hydrolase